MTKRQSDGVARICGIAGMVLLIVYTAFFDQHATAHLFEVTFEAIFVGAVFWAARRWST